jgi:hypothetical protein
MLSMATAHCPSGSPRALSISTISSLSWASPSWRTVQTTYPVTTASFMSVSACDVQAGKAQRHPAFMPFHGRIATRWRLIRPELSGTPPR